MLLASVSLFAQTNVSGVVTGADGVPIPGVAVLIQGTKTGQATSIDGSYSISVSGKNPILEISCIGYVTQEIPVNGRSVIDVVLEEEKRKRLRKRLPARVKNPLEQPMEPFVT